MRDLIAFIFRMLSGAKANWRGCRPDERQRVYFANHTSHLDAVVIWAILPRPIRLRTRPVAAKDYWMAGRFRQWVAEAVFRGLLIERHHVTAHNNPLHDMKCALDAGDSLIIFPEGTRSGGLEPQSFKSGIFHLARECQAVEFIPVYLENLNRILPRGEFLPVPLLGRVTIGSPIKYEQNETREAFLERARLAVWNLHTG